MKEPIIYTNNVPYNPKVSICVQTYNHAFFINECLESLLNQQTNFEYEILLGEDDSIDNTRNICIHYAENYPDKIKLIIHHRENNIQINGKPSGRFNLLYNLNSAKGKYIALCEGDDYWTDPLKLQKQVDFLETNPTYSGCFHYTNQVYENEPEKKGRLFGKHNNQLDFTAEDTIATLSPWHTSSFIFRTEALTIPEWLYKVFTGDMALFSIVAASGKIRCIPEIMSVYRKNDGGVTNTAAHTNELYHKNRITLINYLDEFHNFKYHKKALKVIASHQYSLKNPLPRKKTILEKIKNKIRSYF